MAPRYHNLGKLFFWGFLISFLGTLPLSALNVTAMQISIAEGITQAMLFSIGTIVTELVYARITLIGVSWILKKEKLLRKMEWIIVLLLLLFAAGSFYGASGHQSTENVLLHNHLNRFVLGMLMSSAIVMHFVFWFGWSSVLFAKKILQHTRLHFNLYIVAIGLGTFVANGLFIYGGQLISRHLSSNNHLVNLILGWIFVLTAFIQAGKILWSKGDDKLKAQLISEVQSEK